MSGKGDTYRPVNKKKYDENYERIFGRKCLACSGLGYYWDKDQNGNPIKQMCLLCLGKGLESRQP